MLQFHFLSFQFLCVSISLLEYVPGANILRETKGEVDGELDSSLNKISIWLLFLFCIFKTINNTQNMDGFWILIPIFVTSFGLILPFVFDVSYKWGFYVIFSCDRQEQQCRQTTLFPC